MAYRRYRLVFTVSSGPNILPFVVAKFSHATHVFVNRDAEPRHHAAVHRHTVFIIPTTLDNHEYTNLFTAAVTMLYRAGCYCHCAGNLSSFEDCSPSH
jgi:hypothetical protein